MLKRRKFIVKSKSQLKRRPPTREVPDRVLIVTEGSRTEPNYFRLLIDELGLLTAQVQIVGDGGSAPITVVNDGIKILERDGDFEQVYFVFDRDCHENYDRALAAIRGLSKQRKYNGINIVAATSVPCFEIWFMMHVSPSRKPYESANTGGSPGAALLSDLKKQSLFSCYEKGKCTEFKALSSFRDMAKSRAEAFLKQAQAEGQPEFHENPSTRTHLVVSALENLSKVRGTK